MVKQTVQHELPKRKETDAWSEPYPVQGLVPDGPAADDRNGLDLRAVLAAVYRNRLIFVIVITLALLTAVVVTMLTTPIYVATSSVQIEQQTATILEKSDVEPTIPMADADRFLETQASILRSRALAERVAYSLNLAKNDRFIEAMGGEAPQATGRALIVARHRRVVGLLMKNLTIKVPTDSRVASISFASPSPEIAAQVANSYADNYIRSNLERRFDSSAYARQFLQNQIAQTKERLEDSEQALLVYARSEGLVETSVTAQPGEGGGASSLTTANLRDINASYVAVRAERVKAEQRWNQARNTPLMSLPEVQASPVVQALMTRRATELAALSELRSRYRPDHPSVEQAVTQLATLDREINTQASNVRNGIRNAYDVLVNQEKALESNVQGLSGSALSEQGLRVRYNILKREVDTNRSLYEALLQRYKELAATAGVATSNISVIDTAQTPGAPAKPDLFLNLAFALFAGLGIGALAAFVREHFDDAIRTPDEVQRKLGLQLLGVTPVIATGAAPVEELHDPKSPLSEAYHSLRTSISFASTQGQPRTILFTSSRPEEGKSTSSIAIAQEFGSLGQRVLLIDGDLRKPSLHKVLKLSAKTGLSNVLAQHLELGQAVQRSGFSNVDFVSSGPIPPNPTELLASHTLLQLLATARESYDTVVIDGPPVIGLADAQLLSRQVDATVFVAQASRSHRGQAKAAVRRLRDANANVIGAVLTKFDAKRSGYGYGYGYGYAYDYTYGQTD
ncbi:polysaccharide biosynthesis tyrosine autokinase [Sphingomonas sp. G-3-2-10]|uniref:GumC family protein n=1 Tax=Sphingomonas sp. G-3-2-10 TaxID=2728838 RepID=UPI00146E9560|nr:polysaccharide biosynthesis tyrosine autokinase [Sphingomonas sp. G-3-2-10]NML04465.1 polysaccharide biosynthesis tyrosine autokinase [Sphingomonas sp. G-3-2-10]